jgi:hypothetical protein
MILERSMMQAECLKAGIKWVDSSTADEIFARFNKSGRRLISIDGFMGSGKSPFGSMMESRFGKRCIRMDRYLPARPDPKQPSLIERMDLGHLQRDLLADLDLAPALIEGALVRDLLDKLGVIGAGDVFHVYVAGAWMPDDTRVTWTDANQLGSEQGVEPHRQIVEYHRRQRPHERFDAAVLRNQDQLTRTGAFTAPDGQQITVTETVWPRNRLDRLRVNRWAYACSIEDAREEPIGLIRPPVLSEGAPALEDARFAEVLKAITAQVPLPPVLVEPESSGQRLCLTEGMHRYFASVVAGLTFVPTIQRSAEAGARAVKDAQSLQPAIE